jgi:hypothetical protein
MMTNETPSRPSKVVRLVFRYEGDEVHLVDRQRFEAPTPPAETVTAEAQGAWVEVRSAEDETLFQRVLPGAVRADVEVFSPNPEQSVARAPVERPSGIFTVVVPETDVADHVVVLASGISATEARISGQAEPAAPSRPVELTRVSLREEGQQG